MTWEIKDLLAKVSRDREQEELERVRAAEEKTSSRLLWGVAKWVAGPVGGWILKDLWDRL